MNLSRPKFVQLCHNSPYISLSWKKFLFFCQVTHNSKHLPKVHTDSLMSFSQLWEYHSLCSQLFKIHTLKFVTLISLSSYAPFKCHHPHVRNHDIKKAITFVQSCPQQRSPSRDIPNDVFLGLARKTECEPKRKPSKITCIHWNNMKSPFLYQQF